MLQRGDVNLGHLFGLIAALSWAIYAIYFARGGISVLAATAVFSLWSALLLLPFCLGPLLAAIETVPFREIALQAAVQGVAIGLFSILLFGASVRLLGAPQSAAFSAMTPVVAALIAIPMLGEWPSVPAAFAIAAITAGVMLANWPSRRAVAPAP